MNYRLNGVDAGLGDGGGFANEEEEADDDEEGRRTAEDFLSGSFRTPPPPPPPPHAELVLLVSAPELLSEEEPGRKLSQEVLLQIYLFIFLLPGRGRSVFAYSVAFSSGSVPSSDVQTPVTS